MLNEFITKLDCLKANNLQSLINDTEAEIIKLERQISSLKQTKNSLMIRVHNQKENFFNEFIEENLHKLKADLEGKLYILDSTEKTLILFNDIYVTSNNELNINYFKIILKDKSIIFMQGSDCCPSLSELKALLKKLTLFTATDFDSYISLSTILINKYQRLNGNLG